MYLFDANLELFLFITKEFEITIHTGDIRKPLAIIHPEVSFFGIITGNSRSFPILLQIKATPINPTPDQPLAEIDLLIRSTNKIAANQIINFKAMEADGLKMWNKPGRVYGNLNDKYNVSDIHLGVQVPPEKLSSLY